VISAENSSLIEVGGDHVLFTEPEGEAIGQAVNEVWDWNQTQRNEVIRSAYLWSQEFSWEKSAQKTIEVYQKVLNHES
jgi:glycogen synthase